MDQQLCIAGLEINVGSWNGSLDQVMSSLQRGPVRVYFVNAHCVNVAQQDPLYHTAVQSAEFAFNDGAGIEIASHILGQSIGDNLEGTDWIPALFDRIQAAGKPVQIYLLGARMPVVEAAAQLIPSQWPMIKVAGYHHGYFDEEEAILTHIERAQPDILLVAMGVPKQELFIHRNWEELKKQNIKLALAGGAVLDFLTRAVPRAPLWMRKSRVEWAYRLWNEPLRLWRRYLWGNIKFFYLVIKQRLNRNDNK